ncbi:MAG: hypothetical protein WC872_00940 [Candidatus Absconditabacterales bacterium]
MTTTTLTKENYFEVISKMNDLLFKKKKLMINIDSFDRIETLYKDAVDEYKKGKTIYGGEVRKNGK